MIDPTILPPYVVADLYGKRWRIEQAFNTVKRLLDLSYLWTGSIKGIELQVWGTLNIKLIIAPFPDRQKGQEHFFFETPLTSCFPA